MKSTFKHDIVSASLLRKRMRDFIVELGEMERLNPQVKLLLQKYKIEVKKGSLFVDISEEMERVMHED